MGGGEVIARKGCGTHSQQLLLTEQFYRWEKRGRGWEVWEVPVELEPPFQPFVFHYVPQAPVVDDARKPTFLSSLVDRFKGSSSTSVVPHVPPSLNYETVLPSPSPHYGAFVEMAAVLPSKAQVTPDQAGQFLLALRYAAHPMSFEVIGLPDAVRIQFVCYENDRLQLRQQLQAYFPDMVVRGEEGFLRR